MNKRELTQLWLHLQSRILRVITLPIPTHMLKPGGPRVTLCNECWYDFVPMKLHLRGACWLHSVEAGGFALTAGIPNALHIPGELELPLMYPKVHRAATQFRVELSSLSDAAGVHAVTACFTGFIPLGG